MTLRRTPPHRSHARSGPVTFSRFKSTNHPQQVAKRGAREDIDSRATHASVFAPLDERFNFSQLDGVARNDSGLST